MIINRNFEDADFSNGPEMPEKLEHFRFTDCLFNSRSLTDTELVGCVFERCSFDFTHISGEITKCAFLNCSFRFADLLGAEFVDCKMTGSDLSQLSRADYSISGGDWSFTELSKLYLKNRDLRGLNLSCANIFDCRFEGCKLDGVRFDGSVINKLSLKKSDIRGASFRLVNLAQIDFKGCTADIDFCITFAKANGITVR